MKVYPYPTKVRQTKQQIYHIKIQKKKRERERDRSLAMMMRFFLSQWSSLKQQLKRTGHLSMLITIFIYLFIDRFQRGQNLYCAVLYTRFNILNEGSPCTTTY
jgi:hypothetical protein